LWKLDGSPGPRKRKSPVLSLPVSQIIISDIQSKCGSNTEDPGNPESGIVTRQSQLLAVCSKLLRDGSVVITITIMLLLFLIRFHFTVASDELAG
jgi:hypothetical protein